MRSFLWLGLAIVAIFFVLRMMGRERFQPEFLDKSQVNQTVAMENSSHIQATNHYMPGTYDAGPVQGMATPFQVNQWKSFVPV